MAAKNQEWPEVLLQTGSSLAQYMLDKDWSQHDIGPLKSWPPLLRLLLINMFSVNHPLAIYWSEEYFFFCNDAMVPIIGEKDVGKIGKTFFAAFPDDNDEMLHAGKLLKNAMVTGTSVRVPHFFIPFTRQGELTEIYVAMNISPLRDDRGHCVAVEVSCVERTADVYREQHMSTLRRLSLDISQKNSVSDVFDACMGVIEGHSELFPFAALYRRHENSDNYEIYRSIGIGIPPGTLHKPIHQADLKSGVGEVPPFPIERTSRTKIFGPPSRAYQIPIDDRDGHCEALLIIGLNPGTVWDQQYQDFLILFEEQLKKGVITAKAWQQSLQKVEDLSRLDRIKTEFFSNVSHEFRVPLALILGPIEELLGRDEVSLSWDSHKDLQCIRDNALRLLKLVNSVLEFSRIQAGKSSAAFVASQAGELTRGYCSILRASIEKAGLEFNVHCPDLPESVHLDRDLWEKIILNLLSNALKFTYKGSISVDQWITGRWLCLEVSDTGVGMDAVDTQDIFKRFHRVAGAMGRTHEGSGLGLALVDEFVKAHGGRITVASEKGHGSRFLVEIPLGKNHLPLDQIKDVPRDLNDNHYAEAFITEAQRWSEPTQPKPELSETAPLPLQIDGRRPRLLIVDDNKDMLDYLQRMLGRIYDLRSASDGETAFAMAQAEKPDIVVSDIMMPRWDGVRLLRELRQDPGLRTIPILFLTARADDKSKLDGIEAGVDDIVTKPFSSRELKIRLEGLLRLYMLRRESERHEAILTSEREAARLSNRLKDEFLRTLAHELRTPLVAIQGCAEILGDMDPESDTFFTALETLERNAATEIQFINEIMDFSFIRSGNLRLHIESLDLADLIDSVLEEQHHEIQFKRIHIITQLPTGPQRIQADESLLKQVLGSILNNSIKFSEIAATVIISAYYDENSCNVQVIDQGIGIDAQALPFVCDPFRQGDASYTRRHGGLGLGLSVAKAIIDEHHGQLTVASAGTGFGTTVTLKLPKSLSMREDQTGYSSFDGSHTTI